MASIIKRKKCGAIVVYLLVIRTAFFPHFLLRQRVILSRYAHKSTDFKDLSTVIVSDLILLQNTDHFRGMTA